MSTVILDTITGKSTATTITIGSTPVVSASANSMTIRGEGTAQTSIQQGLAKAWVNLDGTGTIAISDSYNVSSLIDIGVGQYEVVFTNALSDANYSATSSNNGWGLGGTYNVSTAKFKCVARDHQFNIADVDAMMGQVCGDLA
jgi:hypothetical protein